MIDIYKMGGIIAAIIILIRLKVPLSITLSASAVILGWLYRMTFAEIANGMLKTIISIENLYLILVLQLVLVFSALLKENGSMGRAIAALNRLFQDARFTVVFIPAVIGLLPVVGGAMLSAPLVAEASDELNLSRERRTFLNYWFRHVWEYTMPCEPANAGALSIPAFRNKRPVVPARIARPPMVPVKTGQDRKG